MEDGSLASLWLVSNDDDESRLGCLMMEYVLLDSFRRIPPVEDNDWEIALAGEMPRFTVSVPFEKDTVILTNFEATFLYY